MNTEPPGGNIFYNLTWVVTAVCSSAVCNYIIFYQMDLIYENDQSDWKPLLYVHALSLIQFHMALEVKSSSSAGVLQEDTR